MNPVDADLPVSAAQLRPVAVRWLWEDRIPRRAITLLVGNPGVGKSLLTLHLAARLSRGDLGRGTGRTLLLSAEDPWRETVMPRLVAAGANQEMVMFPPLESDGAEPVLVLPDDLDRVEKYVVRGKIDLLVIDPLSSYLRGSIDTWRESSVRSALAPLSRLARKHDLAIVVVAHLNKGVNSDPLRRVGGSIGFTAEARSVLLLANDPDSPAQRGRRILAHAKSNFGPLTESRLIQLHTSDHGNAFVEEIGNTDLTAADLLVVEEPEPRNKRLEAIEFLTKELANGQRLAREVLASARQLGISETTLHRARKDLGVRSTKIDLTQWAWQLPSTPSEDEEAAA